MVTPQVWFDIVSASFLVEARVNISKPVCGAILSTDSNWKEPFGRGYQALRPELLDISLQKEDLSTGCQKPRLCKENHVCFASQK